MTRPESPPHRATLDRSPPSGARRRRLIAGLAFAMVFPTVLTWAYFLRLGDSAVAVQQAVYVAGKTLQFVFPAAFGVWVLARRPRFRAVSPRLLLEGLISGLFALASVLTLYELLSRLDDGPLELLAERVETKTAGLGVGEPAAYLALAAFYSLAHSLLEEYYWRWFVFGRLRELLPLRPALVLAGASFAAHHLIVMGVYTGWDSPLTYLFTAAVALGGAYWCWLYERGRSLFPVWLSHALVDVAIFAVGWRLL